MALTLTPSCEHDISDQDVAVQADGMCPLCQAVKIEQLQANQERMWCKACGTVTRDRQCDCTKFLDQDTQSLVNYADAMQAAAHEEAQENERLLAALKEAKELIDEGESGYISGTGGDTDWNTRAAAFLRAYEQKREGRT